MGKFLRRSVKYLIMLAGVAIMVPTMLFLLLQLPSVQTAIVRKLTNYLSGRLDADISVGRVSYRFFNRISLANVLFLDRNNDTLLYADKLTAGIRKIGLKDKKFRLGRVTVDNPEFNLITDSAGQMNLTWYLDRLKGKQNADSSGINLSIESINLADASFSLMNRSGEKKKRDHRIDFSDMNLGNIDGTVENFRIQNDTTSFTARNVSFKEKNGLNIISMHTDAAISGSAVMLNSLYIRTDSSILNLEKMWLKPDTSGFKKFLTGVRLDIRIDKSLLHSSDLAWFAPVPAGLNESISVSGRFAGTVSELRGRNINLSYGDATKLDFNFDISGLPDIDNSFIYLGFNSLTTTARDMEQIKIPGKKKLVLPEVLYRLGKISFDGSFSGFTTDFVTYGEFVTDKGSLRTDLSLRPESSHRYRIRGLVRGQNINLGYLSDSDLLGALSMSANVDAYASSVKKFSGNLTGKIDSVEVNSYNYRNIDLKGVFSEKTWDGSINIADENIRLDLLGMLNFNDTLPEFDFTMNLANANLYKLNIDKKDSTSALSVLITSNFKGDNIDNMDGEIKLLNSSITRHGENMELYNFSIRTLTENNKQTLSLRTDFVDADVTGSYNFKGLKYLVESTVSRLMPTFTATAEKDAGTESGNNFNFNVNFKNTDRINEFLGTGLQIAAKSYLKGSVTSSESISIEGKSEAVGLKSIVLRDLNFSAGISGSALKSEILASSLDIPGATDLKNFAIRLGTSPDNFTVTTDWNNKETVRNEGSIAAHGTVMKNAAGKAVLRIGIDSTVVYASDNPWIISKSSVLIDSSSVKISNIHVGNNDRFYRVDGTVSENPSDTLHLDFSGIDLKPLNYLASRKKPAVTSDTAQIRLNIAGRLNGTVDIANVYKNLLLESNIIITNFSMLGSRYGNIFVNSEYNYSRKVVDISTRNDLGGTNMFSISGFYDPVNKKVNIGILASKLPIDALNPLLKVFASDISGFATGRLNLTGTFDNLVLTGSVYAQNAKMKINYLQTSYTLNDSIRFDRTGFRFNNVRILDEEKRQGTINGIVSHKNFRGYAADLTITMSNNFLVMNTTAKDNPLFYGKVYASGVTKIKTMPNLLSFDIVARTGSNTRFFIPLSDELSVTEYPFISFINHDGETHVSEAPAPPPVPKTTGINLDMDLTVTSDAVAEIIFDEKVGDKITGSGSGLLNITMNPKGEFRITGDYLIERGDYLFTLGNILNKKFEVENGGKISFNGPLDDAEIDLKAIYQKFNTSLFPVTQDPRDQETKVAVEPQLLLSGKLFNPTVKFQVDLPNADEEQKTYLANAIATDEEMSRQFMYLLVMKSFYSDQTNNISNSNSAGTSAISATTFEMVSNQLSNWISQINENFNLGLNYRPGNKENLNSDELQFAFETQLLDDRVTLNGNFDYRATTGTTDRLTGDFEADLKITDKLRFKVFNRFNDTYYSGKGPYTQGIGIFFKEDFQKFSDLFRKKTKENAKKEDEVTLSDK
jgi:hypothetical protein